MTIAARRAAEPGGGHEQGRAAKVTLLASALGFFIVTLDATVVNVALPEIGRHLHSGMTGLQWVVDGYTLAFAALLLSSGSFADRFGASRCFSTGVAVFTLASVACGLSPTMPFLLTARVVQGSAAALLLPASLALIRHTYQDDAACARAIGIWTAAGGAAVAAGPVVGGLLTSTLGWPSIFLVNVPVGVVALVAVARTPRSVHRPAPLDLAGQLTALVALGTLTYAVIDGGANGWGSTRAVVALVVFVLASAAFLIAEARTADPMVPLGLFRAPAAAVTTATGLVLNLANYGLVFVLSLYFQQVRGQSVLDAGLMFIPMTGFVTVSNLLAGRLTSRHGPRMPLAVGQILQAIGFLALLTVDAHQQTWIMLTLLVPIGVGAGLSVPPLTAALLQAADSGKAGAASGILSCARQIGGALGVAIFGTFVADRATFLTGLHTAALTAAILLALTTASTLYFLRPPKAPRST